MIKFEYVYDTLFEAKNTFAKMVETREDLTGIASQFLYFAIITAELVFDDDAAKTRKFLIQLIDKHFDSNQTNKYIN